MLAAKESHVYKLESYIIFAYSRYTAYRLFRFEKTKINVSWSRDTWV
jgi:hypothetical protein